MAVNIEKMRADMAAHQKQLDRETRKFAVSITLAAPALDGAGIAIGNYFTRQGPQIVFQPGAIVVQQPAPAQK